MARSFVLSLTAAPILLLLGCAGDAPSVELDRPLVPDAVHVGIDTATPREASQAILNGRTDNATTHVVALTSRLGLCSGSLVAPNLVLTAFHCVAESPGDGGACGERPFTTIYPARTMRVTTDTVVDDFGGTFFDVAELVVPDGVDDICGGDLAMLILEESIPASLATPMVPRLDVPVVWEERYSAVGYGAPNAGTRRRMDDLELYCDGRNCDAPEVIGLYDWYGQGAACRGDSGGPAID